MRMLRRSTWILRASVALIAAACSVGPGPSPTSAPASLPVVTDSGPVPTTSVAPGPSTSATAPATACPATAQTVSMPSDRLVDLAISSTSTGDLVTFVFVPSTPGPGGPPSGSLDGARPPFSYAGSGLPIDLLGEQAVQVRFTGMTIATEAGAAVYTGPPDVKPNLPALQEAIAFDASEGVIGWYLGYDGPGCVTLGRTGNDVTVTIAHPEVPAG